VTTALTKELITKNVAIIEHLASINALLGRSLASDELLVKEIVRDEGYREKAYKDSLGNWTIGVGHFLGATTRMSVLTAREIYALLDADIAVAKDIVTNLFPTLDPNVEPVRYRVLVNMAFNMGQTTLAKFVRLIAAVAISDWPGAVTSMHQSLWATQVGARAVRLEKMMATGVA